ncbi:MAG: Dessication-associated protein [Sphingomonas bacterium]|uniref:ferritin-like domain-containing protein n=1 Tax=Sphingomonas bacterium TaxID=1895847 RepID=UPI00260936E7|nr:ferritin-like domain-containing protein [Sphingomonas bacterium]MDB5707071.1 Dessication-associated protein [Sphingomonas bacterium]
MNDTDTLIQVIAADDRRRAERRRFLGIAAGATLAAGLAACSGSSDSTPTPTPTDTGTPTPTPTSTVALDVDYLNFALQLQYLEAQYFAWATTGAGVAASLLTGTGTQGALTGGAQVTFTDTLLGQYAREIAAGELAHLGFLRSATGAAAAAQPAIDISSSATGGFTKLARAAGVVGPTATFDPYASELNFLLGAFMVQDVVVSAYNGSIPSIVNLLYINAAADILATKSFHAAMIRAQLYARGVSARTATDNLSAARDALDGPTDIDQGVTGDATTANITPTDANGIVFGRTTGQTLNVLYTNHAAVVGGGFYPSGIISTYFNTSAAN